MAFLIILCVVGVFCGSYWSYKAWKPLIFTPKSEKIGITILGSFIGLLVGGISYLLIFFLPINCYWENYNPNVEPHGEVIIVPLRELPGTENYYITDADFNRHYCYYVIGENNYSYFFRVENADIEENLYAGVLEIQPYRLKNPIMRFFFIPVVDLNHYTLHLPNTSVYHEYNINSIN